MKNLSAPTTAQLVLNSSGTSRSAALSWRARGIATLRVCFGLVWVVAAWLKWQPAFISNFSQMIAGVADGQPGPVQAWIKFWVMVVNINPSLMAYGSAVIETLIAAFLVLGGVATVALLVVWSLMPETRPADVESQ